MKKAKRDGVLGLGGVWASAPGLFITVDEKIEKQAGKFLPRLVN